MPRRHHPFAVPMVWASVLVVIALLHVQLNRGGLARVFSRERDRLAVGHLPVT